MGLYSSQTNLINIYMYKHTIWLETLVSSLIWLYLVNLLSISELNAHAPMVVRLQITKFKNFTNSYEKCLDARL